MPASTTVPSHSAILERLTRLHPKIIDLSLGRIERLLASLGNPERAIPAVIHIAGTNGKGSVAATLDAMLRAAGLTAHLYTSPHLVRFNERIRLNGADITDDELVAALGRCEAANAGQPITFFEITTAAAFIAFARAPADAVVLETGLGGRLDATNVLAKPLLTVITPVSLDHQHYLGDTLAAIAAEKAGILKAGVPCVVARQLPDALATITARAAQVGAPLIREGIDFTAEADGAELVFRMADAETLRLPMPSLAGQHQVQNAGLALAAIEIANRSGLSVSPAARRQGMATVRWPARLQRLHGRLAQRLGGQFELWLDGGHNPGAGEVLAVQAARWADRPLDLVVGMLGTKDNAGFLRPLQPFVRRVRTVPIPGEAAALDAETLATIARGEGFAVEPASGIESALDDLAGAGAVGPARVLICGSLYLAGRVLAADG